MRLLVVLAAMAALAAANPRQRRQQQAVYPVCRSGVGECVPYYLCRDGSIVTDGSGIIDIRIQPQPECESLLDVCCGDYIEPTEPPLEPYTAQCGRRNTQGIDVRIQGFKGNETQFAEFPWMAAVLKKETVAGKEINLYACGGSLIDRSVVLTAAHCVQKNGAIIPHLKVRLGEWDTQNEYELYKHQDRDVASVTVHPGFIESNLHNDFALLFLSEPAVLSHHVDTICLTDSPAFLYNGNRCVVTGWGRDRFGKEGVFQNVLKHIELPVVVNSDCQNYLRNTRLGLKFILDKSFMCAGGEPGKDSCSGDGGSPLVCPDSSGIYHQVGIVAWGIGCGTENVPGVYANTVEFNYWIQQELQKIIPRIA